MKQWKILGKEDNVHPSNYGRRDVYWLYSLAYDKVCEMIDEWFIGEVSKHETKEITYVDEIITVKVCDAETTNSLYRRPINPVTLRIMCPLGAKFKSNERDELLYNMKVHVHSIDDSSYGIWFNEIPMKTMLWLREEVKKYLDSKEVINGEELLNYCESLGGVDKDYN